MTYLKLIAFILVFLISFQAFAEKLESIRMLRGYRGEEKGESLEGGATWIPYLNEEERKLYRASINDNGQFVNADGKPASGSGIWVLSPEKQFYFYNYDNDDLTKPGFHHSSFLAGSPVSGAGDIVVEDGIIISINDRSGHYAPPPKIHKQAMDHLRTFNPKVLNISSFSEELTPERQKLLTDILNRDDLADSTYRFLIDAIHDTRKYTHNAFNVLNKIMDRPDLIEVNSQPLLMSLNKQSYIWTPEHDKVMDRLMDNILKYPEAISSFTESARRRYGWTKPFVSRMEKIINDPNIKSETVYALIKGFTQGDIVKDEQSQKFIATLTQERFLEPKRMPKFLTAINNTRRPWTEDIKKAAKNIIMSNKWSDDNIADLRRHILYYHDIFDEDIKARFAQLLKEKPLHPHEISSFNYYFDKKHLNWNQQELEIFKMIEDQYPNQVNFTKRKRYRYGKKIFEFSCKLNDMLSR